MILLKPWGGLGNQMFQYATAYALSLRNEDRIVVDTAFLDDRSEPDSLVSHRELELEDVFGISIERANNSLLRRFGVRSADPSVVRLFSRFLHRLNRARVLVEEKNRICSEIERIQGDVCLVGSWQSEEYFKSYRNQIKSLFSFRHPVDVGSVALLDQIRSSQSVCIHVRRGDYVSSSLYAEAIGALTRDYFDSAVNFVRSELEDPRFYVFSNDLNWCRDHLAAHSGIAFVGDEHVGHRCSGYLQLMMACRHSIISNSTFSWWAAWLGEGTDSLIVAPDSWTRSGVVSSDQIVPRRWLRLENGFQ